MEPNCNQLHLQPEKWIKGRTLADGRVACFCPLCRKFKGYIVPATEPKRKGKHK